MSAKPAKTTAAQYDSETLHGAQADAANPDALRELIEHAFDYRGDVTLTLRSTQQSIEGYLFNRAVNKSTGEMVVRMMPKDSDETITVPFADIERLAITGKDTASGKTFENWIKKYAEKKLTGEIASIESESLE